MDFRPCSRPDRFGVAGLAVSLTIALGGCSDSTGTPSSGAGGSTSSGGQAPSGGQSAASGQTSSAGQGSAGGKSGGDPLGGTSSAAAGQAGASTGGSLVTGGASGASMGGAAPGGSGSGVGGAGGAATDGCTRALLDGLLDAYFAALSAGDPSSLPLAESLKFTENAQVAQLGSTSFWKNAGDTKYSQRALDTTACSVAAQAVIPESGVDLPVAVRIKVEGGKMTEIETIVVRQGDYTASFAVASNPAAIIESADEIGWHDEIPEAQRASRQQLTGWIDKYFRAFPAGVCNVTSACRRLENGGGNFACGGGASCTANAPTSGGELVPRVIIVDELRGIAAGLTIFDYQTTGHLDMHMVKMAGGQVRAVQAILRNTNGQSGWD